MYADIINAIDKGLYEGETGIFVVDTHSKGEFHADISVAHQKDDRLPYCLRYFIELKIPKNKLKTAENCGQILDYFNSVHERQPYRSEFVAILSNFESSWVFIATYDHQNNVDISEQGADHIADAVLFADRLSNSQYSTRIPELDSRFGSQYSILAVSHHHFLLSLSQPKPSVAHTPARTTRSQVKSSSPKDDSWRNPSRHTVDPKCRFVLKVMHGQASVANEIAVLKRFRDAVCPHLPEIVWTPSGNRELGIVPVGMPINFREPQTTSRKIVQCLIDGLKFLHELGIVHRDIRPSNLILDYDKPTVNVVIIDYETAVVVDDAPQGVEYHGGFICWPKRLIENNTVQYKPKPEDDLLASILLVLHMLFPLHFDAFPASQIGVGGTPSPETMKLKNLWDDIENSRIWAPFVEAAKARNYELLKGMADVFCHLSK
jgi:Protein kinase domain